MLKKMLKKKKDKTFEAVDVSSSCSSIYVFPLKTMTFVEKNTICAQA